MNSKDNMQRMKWKTEICLVIILHPLLSFYCVFVTMELFSLSLWLSFSMIWIISWCGRGFLLHIHPFISWLRGVYGSKHDTHNSKCDPLVPTRPVHLVRYGSNNRHQNRWAGLCDILMAKFRPAYFSLSYVLVVMVPMVPFHKKAARPGIDTVDALYRFLR